MGYNGLAKEFKKRWSRGKAPDANEAAPEAQSERTSVAGGAGGGTPQDWTEDAQDQITALLDGVSDDTEDDAIELAAIRRALAEKDTAPVTEDASEAQDDDLYLVIDEILSPESPVEAPPATEALHEEATDAPDAGAESEAATPKAAAMEPLFKDPVVTELLEQGAVTLPQALTAVRRQAEEPGRDLWRILAELPNADRMLVYEQAANLLGFETIDIGEKFSPAFIQTIVELLPPLLRENLFTFNLLPLKLKADPEARQQSLILATPDPSHPDLQPILEELGMPVELFFATEEVVTQHLEEVMALLDDEPVEEASLEDVPLDEIPLDDVPLDDALLDDTVLDDQGASNEEPAAEVEPEAIEIDLAFDEPETAPTAEDDKALVEKILDLSGTDADFLELQWEPEDREETDADAEPQAAADKPVEEQKKDVEWQTLAALTPSDDDAQPSTEDDAAQALIDSVVEHAQPEEPGSAAFDFTPEELAKLGQTDVLPADEISLDHTIAPELLDAFSDDAAANGEAHANGDPSFDGSPSELPHEDPVSDISDWTQQDQQEQRPAEPSQPVPEAASEPEAVSEVEEVLDVVNEQVEELLDVDLDKIRAKDRVVAMLLRKDIVSPREIKRAQQKQQQEELKEPLWRVLTLIDDVNRTAIFAEAASVYAFKAAELDEEGKPDPEFARSVMETFDEDIRDGLLKLRVVPFEVDLDQQTGAIKVVFITHDPTRPEVHRMMQKLRLERFELRYAPEKVVTGLIQEAFPRKNEFLERLGEDDAFDMGINYEESNDLIDEDALEAEINRSKLINLFEATLVEAVRQDASDVHIWPNARKQVEIHFRIDGRLRRWHVEDKVHPEAFIAVIKDNSMNVDRFEREAAQDGFIQRWIDEALIRFRVSVLPIANVAQEVRSESIVIRVLDDRKVVKDLSKLGLNTLALERFRRAISQPHGMVILTGPTGSGKTTTLYASLHEVINPEVNVLTVEDPVEYILPGVRQIKLNNKLGLDGALRSILRHDPDIVMVGEMRDKPTAELAIKLANTGHLTFSTLHTNDAASAVTRLYKMGIEPFLIAYAINLVVAQRLIRRLCPTCKKEDPDPDHVLMRKLGFTKEDVASSTVYMQGNDENCPTCNGVGFRGRRAVSEAMYFSREIRHLIADSEGMLDEGTIKDLATEQGMMTLMDSAREVVKEGDSSILEMMRVVSTED